MRGTSRQAQPGFSLLEILIVVTIIAILVALLFPVFNKVKRSAKSVSCLSNLRQLGVATILYYEDHDGRLPHFNLPLVYWDGKFENPLLPYGVTQAVLHCPDFAGKRDFDVRSDFRIRFALQLSEPDNTTQWLPLIPTSSSVITYCVWNMIVPNVVPSTLEKRTANGTYNVLRFDGSVARILTERTVTHYENWGGFPPEVPPNDYQWVEFPDEPFPPTLGPPWEM